MEVLFQCFQWTNLRLISCNWTKLTKMYKKRAVLTSQFAVRDLQKQLRRVMQTHLDQSASFYPLLWNVYVTASRNFSFNSINPWKWPNLQQIEKKHINEKSKHVFADNFFKISCKYTQDMLSNWKICFNVFNIRTYGEFLCNLAKLMKLQKQRPVLTSQFDVSKTIKSALKGNVDSFGPVSQLWSVTHRCMRDSKPQRCVQQH